MPWIEVLVFVTTSFHDDLFACILRMVKQWQVPDTACITWLHESSSAECQDL
jgi:hypothetical protein